LVWEKSTKKKKKKKKKKRKRKKRRRRWEDDVRIDPSEIERWMKLAPDRILCQVLVLAVVCSNFRVQRDLAFGEQKRNAEEGIKQVA
jgi:hypothetical protein